MILSSYYSLRRSYHLLAVDYIVPNGYIENLIDFSPNIQQKIEELLLILAA